MSNLMRDPLPVKVGIEVEANFPNHIPESIPIRGELCKLIQPETPENVSEAELVAYFSQAASNVSTRFAAGIKAMPDPYRIPAGWERSTDPSSGMEFKFDGPAEDESDVFQRLSSLVKYFSAWGIKSFANSGTHIHLGIPDWLDAKFSKEDSQFRTRAESLATLYMLTRSNALRKLVPECRRKNQYCVFPFSGKTSVMNTVQAQTQAPGNVLNYFYMDERETPMVISRATPTWAIHNAAIYTTRPRKLFQERYGAIINYRHLPTFEFRLFPGTGSENLLQGYFKLVMGMFENLSKIFEDKTTLSHLTADAKSPYCVNPYSFGPQDLIDEFHDSELKYFLTVLLENAGKLAPSDARPTSFMTTDNMPERIQVI